MLYEKCPVCSGLAFVPVPDRPGICMPCLMCSSLRVVESGLTLSQASHAIERVQRYEAALDRIASACEIGVAETACQVVLEIVREAKKRGGA